jgi:hypothetical protein
LKKRQKFSLWRQKFMACLSTIGVQIEEVSDLGLAGLGKTIRKDLVSISPTFYEHLLRQNPFTKK